MYRINISDGIDGTSSKYQSARVQCNWKLPRVVRVATAVLNENATLAGRVFGVVRFRHGSRGSVPCLFHIIIFVLFVGSGS